MWTYENIREFGQVFLNCLIATVIFAHILGRIYDFLTDEKDRE